MSKWQVTKIGRIPSDWSACPIGSFADVTKLAGFEYTKFFQYIDDGEIIALRALNVRNGVLDLENLKRIRKSVSDELPRSKLIKGDIVFTYTGANYGQFALIYKNNKYHLAPNICKIRSSSKCLPYYLYSYFRTKNFQENLINYTHGSSQPTIPMGNIRQIEIPIPPLHEQEAIVSVISSLDDKIAILRIQKQTLELLAQTLFRQWFIEEAKDEWEEMPLDGIAEYLNGLACQKYPAKDESEKLPVLKIKELRNGISKQTEWATTDVPAEYIVENGEVIFSWSGSLMVKIWDGGKCVLNQHLFKVTSDQYPKWFYYLWTIYHLQKFIGIAESKATTMGHIKRSDLSSSKVSIPTPSELHEMDQVISPIIDKMILNNQQINNMTSLRNTLLPKLMSGEVRVEQ